MWLIRKLCQIWNPFKIRSKGPGGVIPDVITLWMSKRAGIAERKRRKSAREPENKHYSIYGARDLKFIKQEESKR